MTHYYLGIDAGTGSIRAAVFDQDGHLLGNAEAAYPTYYPKNGWAEQDTADWQQALASVVPACLKASGIRGEDLTAIVCDATTNTLVFLDKSGRPVRRPLLWMDVRASEEAKELDTLRYGHGDGSIGCSGQGDGSPGCSGQGDGSPGSRFPAMDVYKPAFRADTMIPKCMWYKRHEPENWAATETVFEFEDWLNYQLTGRRTLSTSVAGFRWNYDQTLGGLPVSIYEAAGIGDVTEKIPVLKLAVGECVGEVTKEAAACLGLSEGTPVYEGTCDCNAAMLGTGCVRPGSLVLVSGTSTAILGHSSIDFHTNGVNGTYPGCLIPGMALAESGLTASGAILTWFKNMLLPGAWEAEAADRGINIYDLIGEKAAAAPLGAGGVVMLDYFQGNRAPYADSSARGLFAGLSIGTDTACIARAIFEGVSYGTSHCVNVMKASGMDIDQLLACGGICSSPFWLQMHADIIGLPITTTEYAQCCASFGNAMIGAVASGVYPDLSAAAKAMVRSDKTYLPDPEAHKKYRFYMDRYLELWPAVRETVHQLVQHESQ